MTTLLAPRDRDGKDEPMPSSLYVMAAPGLVERKPPMLDRQLVKLICKRLPCQPAPGNQFQTSSAELIVLEDYVDPVTKTHATAALAPVGGTGMIVVVATPHDPIDVMKSDMVALSRSLLWGLLVLGVALYAGVLALPALLRRRGWAAASCN